MSETRKAINTLLQQQLNSRDERLEKSATLDDRGMILSDFSIWLDGAMDVTNAIGIGQDDMRSLHACRAANQAELTLLEQKVALQAALSDN